jgi:hypothetical protein
MVHLLTNGEKKFHAERDNEGCKLPIDRACEAMILSRVLDRYSCTW